MIDAVFISDLHLHPEDKALQERFENFVAWAANNTRNVYILGDFFHVWPGDDGLDSWSQAIAGRLSWLATQGIRVYFMHGNRDFLLGQRFAAMAKLTLIKEPTGLTLGGAQVALVHGDRYCTNDKAHQRFRRVTRHPWFSPLFLRLPYTLRKRLVMSVRRRSEAQHKQVKPLTQMDVVSSKLLTHMQQLKVTTLLHGHTHRPGLTTHDYRGEQYQQYVLSDWDDNPQIMCYDKTIGFYFSLFSGDSYVTR